MTADPIHTCLHCGNESCCGEAAAEIERLKLALSGRTQSSDHPGLTCAEAQELIDHYREHANETPAVDRSRFPARLLRFVRTRSRSRPANKHDDPGTINHYVPRAGAGVVYHYDHCSLYDIFAHDYDDCPYNDDGTFKHDDGRANHAAHAYDPACLNCAAGYVHYDGHPAFRAIYDYADRHFDLYPNNDASAAHEHYDDDDDPSAV